MYLDRSQDDVVVKGPFQGTSSSTAQIHEISLERLQSNDKAESLKLLLACMEDGVFYLSLRDHKDEDGPLLSMSTDVFNLSKKLFKLSLDEKMEHDIDKFGGMRTNGYKPVGRNKGGLTGGKDGFESYAIAKNFIMSSAEDYSQAHPAAITDDLPLLQNFATEVTIATSAILNSLSKALHLPPGTGFESCHRLEADSPSMLRLLKYTEQPASERGAPQDPHTDLGSLTLLFTNSPGLQRRNPRLGQDESAWEYIEPRAHCAIVNVGDVMVALSSGVLHSCYHRVVPLPGRKMEERYSFAWMARPEPDTLMAGLKGDKIPEGCKNGDEAITSGEWLARKFNMLRR